MCLACMFVLFGIISKQTKQEGNAQIQTDLTGNIVQHVEDEAHIMILMPLLLLLTFKSHKVVINMINQL